MNARVLVVDDHEVIRDSFRRLFETMPGFEVVGDLASADDADAAHRQLRPDLVLLDVCTDQGASGLQAAKRLREIDRDLRIIVMSGFDEISYSARARDCGANAFVSKDNSMEFFAEVINEVLSGGEHFPEARPLPMPRGETPFTAREMDILKLLCEHKSRAEIAAELYISEMTVKRHVSNMLAKTGFQDSVELAFHVITHGWINPRY